MKKADSLGMGIMAIRDESLARWSEGVGLLDKLKACSVEDEDLLITLLDKTTGFIDQVFELEGRMYDIVDRISEQPKASLHTGSVMHMRSKYMEYYFDKLDAVKDALFKQVNNHADRVGVQRVA